MFRDHDEAEARAWAKLHGFRAREVFETEAGIRMNTQHPHLFVPGKFYAVAITRDISAGLGVRTPASKKRSTPKKGTKRRRR